MARELRFEMWLSLRLENCDFNVMSVAAVVESAGVELGLDRWEVVRLLLKVTHRIARFKSEGGMVSFR
jgi:hypothetical protein